MKNPPCAKAQGGFFALALPADFHMLAGGYVYLEKVEVGVLAAGMGQGVQDLAALLRGEKRLFLGEGRPIPREVGEDMGQEGEEQSRGEAEGNLWLPRLADKDFQDAAPLFYCDFHDVAVGTLHLQQLAHCAGICHCQQLV